MKILVTGGSGTIGKRLISNLKSNGFEIRQLSSSSSDVSKGVFHWDPIQFTMDARALDGVESIIHLAGAGIMDQSWTPERKKLIIESRTRSSEILLQTLKSRNQHIKHFISASAIGIYGDTKDDVCLENRRPGDDFMAEVCQQWEAASKTLKEVADHVSILRIGIVLSADGGYYTEMKKLAKYGMLAPLGSGKQWVSWISHIDLEKIIIAMLNGDLPPSTYNAVSPSPLRQGELTSTLQKHFKTILWPIPVPAFVLKLVLGKRSAAVLGGQKVSAEKLLSQGFTFSYPTIAEYLNTCR